MELTAPAIVLALVIGYVAISILDAVARVLLSETAIWNLRCDVARLQQDYQLQLLEKAIGSRQPIEVVPIDDAEPIPNTTDEFEAAEAMRTEELSELTTSEDVAIQDTTPAALAA